MKQSLGKERCVKQFKSKCPDAGTQSVTPKTCDKTTNVPELTEHVGVGMESAITGHVDELPIAL
eukprot:2960218-Amphidinium_carterae.1